MSWRVECADIIDWCESYEGEPFHAALLDPSYALSKKKPVNRDAPASLPPDATLGDVIDAYHSIMQWGDTGFMNARWDSDLAFDPKIWEAIARHLHPGAFVLAFASSRGWHRLACAMEDAGLLLQPSIFMYGWLNSQSFPKSTRIDTAIDEAAGADREVIGPNKFASINGKANLTCYGAASRPDETAPATPLAQAWAGHRYGGQILKNCLEPIICAQKPWEGKRLDSIVATGAGSLWVDGARVATGEATYFRTNDEAGGHRGTTYNYVGYDNLVKRGGGNPNGRWPPNFCLIHNPPTAPCPHCDGTGLVDSAPLEASFEDWHAQTDGTRDEWEKLRQPGGVEFCPACHGLGLVGGCQRVGVKRVKGTAPMGRPASKQGYSAGFLDGMTRKVDDPLFYADPDGLETCEAWHCTLTCPQGHHWTAETRGPCPECGAAGAWSCPVAALGEQGGERGAHGGIEKVGTGETSWWQPGREYVSERSRDVGSCTRFYPNFGWQHEVAEQLAGAAAVRYCPKSATRERNVGLDDFYWRKDKDSPIGFVRVTRAEWERLPEKQRAEENIHVALKPLDLLIWLATLLAPPPEYAPRRLLVPFAGSGSEMVGAALSGHFEEIVGVEISPDYVDIARARLRWWQGWAEAGRQLTPKQILREAKRREKLEEKLRQMEMGL